MFTEIIVKTQFKIKELESDSSNPALMKYETEKFLKEQKQILIDSGVKPGNVNHLDLGEFLTTCIKAMNMTFEQMEQEMEQTKEISDEKDDQDQMHEFHKWIIENEGEEMIDIVMNDSVIFLHVWKKWKNSEDK